FRKWVDAKASGAEKTVVLNSIAVDFSRGLGHFADAKRVLVGGASDRAVRAALGAASVERITTETTLEIAGERVHLIPSGPAATASDLAVFLEKRSVLFA